jgi:hypothetical protein
MNEGRDTSQKPGTWHSPGNRATLMRVAEFERLL